jgi:hypothetical protein
MHDRLSRSLPSSAQSAWTNTSVAAQAFSLTHRSTPYLNLAPSLQQHSHRPPGLHPPHRPSTFQLPYNTSRQQSRSRTLHLSGSYLRGPPSTIVTDRSRGLCFCTHPLTPHLLTLRRPYTYKPPSWRDSTLTSFPSSAPCSAQRPGYTEATTSHHNWSSQQTHIRYCITVLTVHPIPERVSESGYQTLSPIGLV